MPAPDLTPLDTPPLDDNLAALASAYGIATEYWDWQGRHVTVGSDIVAAVLSALGVDAATPEAAASALERHEHEPWTRMLPPCLALRQHRTAEVRVHVPHGSPVSVWIDLEGGGTREGLRQLENWSAPREVDGAPVGALAAGERTGPFPAGLEGGLGCIREHRRPEAVGAAHARQDGPAG